MSTELHGDSATCSRQIGPDEAARIVAISPDGKLAAGICPTASKQRRIQDVRLFDLETGDTRLISFHGDRDTLPLAMSDECIAVGMRGGVCIRRFAAPDEVGEEEWLEAKTSEVITSLEFSPNGTLLAAGISDGAVVVWNVDAKRRLFELPEDSTRMVTAIGFTPRGEVLATGAEDGMVRIWESTTGRRISEIATSSEPVYSIAFPRDAEILATGGADGTPRAWRDWQSSKCRGHPFLGHSDVISAVMFPPDGQTMITASHDCTLRVWGLRERRVRLSLFERSSIDSADFAIVGLCMVSWCRDGTVRVWRAATKEDVDRTTW